MHRLSSRRIVGALQQPAVPSCVIVHLQTVETVTADQRPCNSHPGNVQHKGYETCHACSNDGAPSQPLGCWAAGLDERSAEDAEARRKAGAAAVLRAGAAAGGDRHAA